MTNLGVCLQGSNQVGMIPWYWWIFNTQFFKIQATYFSRLIQVMTEHTLDKSIYDMWKDTLLNLYFVDPLMKNTASSIEILNWSLFLIWIIGCISCLCGRTVRATPVIPSYKRITGLAVGVILPPSSKLSRQKKMLCHSRYSSWRYLCGYGWIYGHCWG